MMPTSKTPCVVPARSRGWRVSRRGPVFALPALLAGLGVAVAAVAALVAPSGDELFERYAREASRRFEARDYPAALTCYERLAQMRTDHLEHWFGLVRTLEAVGQTRRAEALALILAPVNRPGYAPAQVWLGRRLCVLAGHSKAAARAAEQHLRLVPDDHPLAPEAHALLGSLLVSAGQTDFAERELRNSDPGRPDVQLLFSQIYARQGRKEAARAAAQDAARQLRRRLDAHPDEAAVRLTCASALLILEDFSGAVAILEEGLKRRDDREFHRSLADLYSSWSDALGRDGRGTSGERLDLLERGLRHDPENKAVLVGLTRAIESGGPEAERGRAALRAVLADGKAGAGVHLALGLDAAAHGRNDEARARYEDTLRLAPGFTAVANSLAWLLAHAEPPELDRALRLIDGALERHPDNPTYRDTRGHILMKMGRWGDALVDLEAALAGPDAPPGLHEALADVYDHLGDHSVAEEHRRLSRR